MTIGSLRCWIFIFGILTTVLAATTTWAQQETADSEQIDILQVERPLETVPKEFTLRVRITSLKPAKPSEVRWRSGGEGLGGSRSAGRMPKFARKIPMAPKLAAKKTPDTDDLLKEIESKGKSAPKPPTDHKLKIGQWSLTVPVSNFSRGRARSRVFVTFTGGDGGKLIGRGPNGGWALENASKDFELEFEFRYRDKVIKTFREAGPEGGTVGIAIPYHHLSGGKSPQDQAFLNDLIGLTEYARRRADSLEQLPWAQGRKPNLYAMITTLQGYGEGSYFGIRYANRDILTAEARSLRALGMNGFQGGPAPLIEEAFRRKGAGAPFHRALETNSFGYPVPRHEEGRVVEGAGCPFHPQVPQAAQEGVARSLEAALKMRVDSVWGITVDEIGAVVDASPEGKGHLAVCPHCIAGFRKYLQSKGVTPKDFAVEDWSQIKPLDVWSRDAKPNWRESRRDAMLVYWTRRFNCYASAQLFSTHRQAYAAANQTKREALARGEQNNPIAQQPWVYSCAMRGNTFLMGGHSLDFFNFYRHADNAFVYETSNRDARIWSWDSYLCDVGRVLHRDMDKEFGILVKPHRGAPIQRALSAVGRGAKMINWYTYGPEYAKGDSFSQNPETLKLVAKANWMIAQAEDVLYESSWDQSARIGIVNPRSSEIWIKLGNPAGTAAWENAKWTYMALAHAHLPVDPLDEYMLEQNDLSAYRVLYVNGINLTRAAAVKLSTWVEQGGTLFTSGGGLARDEYNQPLEQLQSVLGLKDRSEPEMWRKIPTYGATRVAYFNDKTILADPPKGAVVEGRKPLAGQHRLHVGRELLHPSEDAEILAIFVDGGVAATRHTYGKGQAYVVGFFPGLEYSEPVLRENFDMSTGFDSEMRRLISLAAESAITPVVDVDQATIEGLLVRSHQSNRRAVVLMNWAYRVAAQKVYVDEKGRQIKRAMVGHVPASNVRITLKYDGNIKQVRSIALQKSIEVKASSKGFVEMVLPRLEEGDVLLID